MRVVAGTARSIPLKSRDGLDTRPTADRVKEAIFNILQFDVPGAEVLDLFGGSGSTLIACEQLGRKCYICELDPKYCDVILQRWENLTGKDAKRVIKGGDADAT